MRIIGIDPGMWEFAWVLYASNDNAIADHGYIVLGTDDLKLPQYDAIIIEDIASVWQRTRHVIDCAKTVGYLYAKFPDALLLARKTVVTILTGSAQSGDEAVDRALEKYIPNLPPKYTRGFTGHHRSALAVAYAGVGRVQARDTQRALDKRLRESREAKEDAGTGKSTKTNIPRLSIKAALSGVRER